MRPPVIVFLVCLVLPPLITAADPGAVTLIDDGKQVTLANGLIEAVINKAGASVTNLRFHGQEMLRAGYYSMDGGKDFRTPSRCIYSITTQSPDLVDIGMRQAWANDPQAVDIEIHYVLKRGDTGLYSYAVLDHPADHPATHFGEWRFVWKLSDDLMETICVDQKRHWRMQRSTDSFEPTPIKEIIHLTSGHRAGQYDCKYDFNAEYHDLGCWGHASDPNQIGAFIVLGGHDYFNDGPTKQDLTAASGINHLHFGLDHYNASETRLAEGQAWSKIYGPFLLYCNHHPSGADACWHDAQERARKEQAAWPYPWVADHRRYPPETDRGSATGTLHIHDAMRPQIASGNAWIGLAQPPEGDHWQFDSMSYQHWVRTAADGSFTIPHVRPGIWTLYAFGDGAVGEYSRTDIRIEAGKTTALGDITWEVPHRGKRIAWEIGVPNRTAREFHGGDDYFHGYRWQNIDQAFPNPLIYTVGTSRCDQDWNYFQGSYPDGKGGKIPHIWRIDFTLSEVPTGAATLVLAIASADRTALQITVNAAKPVIVTPSIQGGNALLREGIHAKYCVEYLTIPADQLRAGANSINLALTSVRLDSSHLMYDYVALELP